MAATCRAIAGSSSRAPRDRRSGQGASGAVAIDRRENSRQSEPRSCRPLAAIDDETSSERKKMDVVSMRQAAPHALGEKQHDAYGERAQNHQVPRAECSQLILQQPEDENADDRSLDGRDATDDDDEENERSPIGDGESRIG